MDRVELLGLKIQLRQADSASPACRCCWRARCERERKVRTHRRWRWDSFQSQPFLPARALPLIRQRLFAQDRFLVQTRPRYPDRNAPPKGDDRFERQSAAR